MALRHEPVVADGRPARRPPSVERVSHRDRETRSTLCRCVTHWRSDGTTPRGRCGSTREPADRPPPLLDAVLSDFLAASLRRPNYDPPISAIYAFPRPLLAPPPPNTCRSSIVSILRGRITQLANGGAQALWASHPWLQTLPAATDFSATCPARAAARMSSAATVKSPSAVYRSLSTPAFLPPTPHTRDLLLGLFPRQYNPDIDPSVADSLPSAADLHLPRPPFPSGFIYDPTERKGTIAAWSRHLATHPTGQPDGTGLRGSLLTLCVSSLPLLCQWLQQLSLHHTTAAHRRRLASKTLKEWPGQARDKQTKAATRPPGGRHDIGCPPQAFLVGEDRA